MHYCTTASISEYCSAIITYENHDTQSGPWTLGPPPSQWVSNFKPRGASTPHTHTLLFSISGANSGGCVGEIVRRIIVVVDPEMGADANAISVWCPSVCRNQRVASRCALRHFWLSSGKSALGSVWCRLLGNDRTHMYRVADTLWDRLLRRCWRLRSVIS